jgi:hypothetical protein
VVRSRGAGLAGPRRCRGLRPPAEYETWGYWYGENHYTPAAGRNFAVGIDYGF